MKVDLRPVGGAELAGEVITGRWLAAMGVLTLGLAGCAGPVEETTVRQGGTLEVLSGSDLARLDPATTTGPTAGALTRVYARTLFGSKASNNAADTTVPQADVAAARPTRENGGISADGRTYTVGLRRGVSWNTEPPREVTAPDFVRGLKRLCNPAAPSGARAYFTATISGMASYCAAFARVSPSARAMARFQADHEISGVQAKDARTLVFRLVRPASDFLNILALPAAAAAPREYDRYVPDSLELRRHTISAGPYQITSYEPGKWYVLDQNPAWRQESDPLRGRHVSRIEITFGQDAASAQARLERGAADLTWNLRVPSAALGRLRTAPGFSVRETPGNGPYLIFDTGPGAAGERREVRQAIEYGIDRTALITASGGPNLARPVHTVIAEGDRGHWEFDLYRTAGDAGDAVTCRDLLAKAGNPHGLSLTLSYRHGLERLARSIRDNLRSCRIRATLTRAGDGAKGGEAGDLQLAARTPDWAGDNGRSALGPLARAASPEIRGLVDQALTAVDTARASGLWYLADRKIMEAAVVVPLVDQDLPMFHSARVRNALFVPADRAYDLTQVWLS
jgi:peptide/nickel transport system substrate-binding protein